MILVTGATGFVGRQLVLALSEEQNKVRFLSRTDQPGFDTVVCDLQNDLIPDDALKGIDTVFHLAGFTHDLSDATEIEHLYHMVNVDATVRLANLAAASGVQRFIFVSSVKAGGSALPGKCMCESDQAVPEGVYGQTKRDAELSLLDIGSQSAMHVSIIRPSLVYGAGIKGNLRMMLNGIDNGWFPPIPDTHNHRSMIHVHDLVRALILVSEDSRANGEIYITTDGHEYSSSEIYEAMCEAVGKQIPGWRLPDVIFKIAAKFGDILDGKMPFPFDSYRYQKLLGDECFSSDKICSHLGFQANYSLHDSLPDMVAALRDEEK